MDDLKFKELYIFGVQAGSGGQNTLKFCNGEISDTSDEEDLVFQYKSELTGKVRKAIFFKANISGFSVT